MLLADDADCGPNAPRAVAARTFEFTEFLVDVLGVEPTSAAARLARSPTTRAVTDCEAWAWTRSHGACWPRPATRLVPLPEADTCCGFGGLFAVKMPDVSGAMLARKCRQIDARPVPTRWS